MPVQRCPRLIQNGRVIQTNLKLESHYELQMNASRKNLRLPHDTQSRWEAQDRKLARQGTKSLQKDKVTRKLVDYTNGAKEYASKWNVDIDINRLPFAHIP